MLGIFADQIYLQGLKENETSYFRLAKNIFPFDKEIVTSEALTFIRNKIIDEKVRLKLKEALRYDPYSAEMLGMYIQYENIYGNKNEAKIAFKKLKTISPNSNITKQLTQILKGFQNDPFWSGSDLSAR